MTQRAMDKTASRGELESRYVRQHQLNQFSNETLADKVSRFENKFIPEPMSGCWLWTGAVSSVRKSHYVGYARVKLGGRVHNASRVSFELYTGEIPAGAIIMHICDNPLCVNPTHLRLGTQAENMIDMHQKGRHKRSRSVSSTRAALPNATGEAE